MATYRAGIVGLSGITASRLSPSNLHPSLGTEIPHSHAGCFHADGRVQVAAVCDIVPERLDNFVKTWGDVWPNITTYTSHKEMVEKERLDIVTVATSDHRHAQIVVDACEAGAKGIFCEKPLATSVADADRMIAAVEKNKVTMTIDHWTRWAPETLQAHEIIRSGQIGQVKRIVCTSCGTRSMLFRNGTYQVDGIVSFAGADAVEVYARLDDEFAGYGPAYAGDGGKDPKTDPGASAMIRFANGVRAFFNYSQGVVQYSEMTVMGETGFVRWHVYDHPLEVITRPEGRGPVQRALRPRPYVERTGMLAAVADLIASMESGTPTLSPPQEARKSVELMIAILQSSHQGQPVKLPLTNG